MKVKAPKVKADADIKVKGPKVKGPKVKGPKVKGPKIKGDIDVKGPDADLKIGGDLDVGKNFIHYLIFVSCVTYSISADNCH